MLGGEEMLTDFKQSFEKMMDSFMNKWGDYIGDADDVEALIQDAFDNWVSDSGWFEQ